MSDISINLPEVPCIGSTALEAQEIEIQFKVPALDVEQVPGDQLEFTAQIAVVPPDAINAIRKAEANTQALHDATQVRHGEVEAWAATVEDQYETVVTAQADIQARHEDIITRNEDVTEKHGEVHDWHTQAHAWYTHFRAEHDEFDAQYAEVDEWYQEIVHKRDMILPYYTDMERWYEQVSFAQLDVKTRHIDTVEKYGILQTQYAELTTGFVEFNSDYTSFLDQLQSINDWHTEMAGWYDTVQQQYEDVGRWHENTAYNQLDVQTRHTDIVSKFHEIRARYEEIVGWYDQLRADYLSFDSQHQDMDAWHQAVAAWWADVQALHEEVERWHGQLSYIHLDTQTRHTDIVNKYDMLMQGGVLAPPNNLSDVPDKAAARANLDVYSRSEVNQQIAQVVGSAPEALDTLYELAAALGNDPNFSTTMMQLIGEKETPAGAQAKVDAFAARRDNPNQVTKAQVGLGNVQNFPVATEAQATAGTGNAYMTPQRTHQAASEVVSGHEAKADPHPQYLAKDAIASSSGATMVGYGGETVGDALDSLQSGLDTKVDKVAGKGLSSEDYTTAEKSKLSGIATGATKNATDAQLRDRSTHTGTQPLSTISDAGDVAGINKNGNASTYLNGAGAWTTPPNTTYSVISTAEIDAGAASTARTISAQRLKYIMDKLAPVTHAHSVSEVTGLQAALDAKVDKVTGKGLSTEDYTTAEKSKLAGIAEGAQVNPPTTASRTSSSTTTVLQAKAMNDHRVSGDHDGRYLQIAGGTATGHIYVNENLGFGKYFYLGDYDDTFSTSGTGLRSYVRDGTWYISAAPGETNPVKIKLSGIYEGNGSELTALNASALSSGTVPDARLPYTATRWPSWSEVTSKPTTFTPSSHNHTIEDVAGLQDALDGKAAVAHNHDAAYYKKAEVDSKIGAAFTPTGAIMAFARPTAPEGWLPCDGRAVSRTTYISLFAAIGLTFGPGDGSTTFNIPDLRGEFIRGWDNGRGVDPGRPLGTAQSDRFGSHTHTASIGSAGSHSHSGTTASSGSHSHNLIGNTTKNNNERVGPITNGLTGNYSSDVIKNPAEGLVTDDGTHTHTFSTNTTGAHTHSVTIDYAGYTETRPRNIALLYCIKV